MSTEVNFINIIKKNLESNGFPAKKVALPLEKLYESADTKGLNLNNILETLRSEGIETENTVDKIIFRKEVETTNPLGDIDLEALKGLGPKELMAKYNEIMSKMSPEQMNSVKSMYDNMSPEEKEEIMKKGKDMGLA